METVYAVRSDGPAADAARLGAGLRVRRGPKLPVPEVDRAARCGLRSGTDVARCRELAPERIDVLTGDWAEVAARRFDLIYAALVLQHLETETCRARLEDFARLAPKTYVLTRLQSDFGRNVLGLVADSGLFEVEACAEVEHDPVQHQLRRVGERSFAEVSRASGDRHYEVRLKSHAV